MTHEINCDLDNDCTCGGSMQLATIAFQPEAHDSAYDAFNRVEGFTVRIVQSGREPFDAQLLGTEFDKHGDLMIRVAPWDESADSADHSRPMQFVVYELDRIEVL